MWEPILGRDFLLHTSRLLRDIRRQHADDLGALLRREALTVLRNEVGDFCEGISGLFLEKLNFLFLQLAQLFQQALLWRRQWNRVTAWSFLKPEIGSKKREGSWEALDAKRESVRFFVFGRWWAAVRRPGFSVRRADEPVSEEDGKLAHRLFPSVAGAGPVGRDVT